MNQTRTHLKILFAAETEHVLSEKASAQGGTAVAASTNDEGFAAGTGRFMAKRVF